MGKNITDLRDKPVIRRFGCIVVRFTADGVALRGVHKKTWTPVVRWKEVARLALEKLALRLTEGEWDRELEIVSKLSYYRRHYGNGSAKN